MHSGIAGQKVQLDRDIANKRQEPQLWVGAVKAGVFCADHLAYVRQQWLQEGIVPRCNVRGYSNFNSITPSTPHGECIVKQVSHFYEDTRHTMAIWGVV